VDKNSANLFAVGRVLFPNSNSKKVLQSNLWDFFYW